MENRERYVLCVSLTGRGGHAPNRPRTSKAADLPRKTYAEVQHERGKEREDRVQESNQRQCPPRSCGDVLPRCGATQHRQQLRQSQRRPPPRRKVAAARFKSRVVSARARCRLILWRRGLVRSVKAWGKVGVYSCRTPARYMQPCILPCLRAGACSLHLDRRLPTIQFSPLPETCVCVC